MRQLMLMVCALIVVACTTRAPTELPTRVPTFPPPPTNIQLNETVTGTLSSAIDEQQYRFIGTANTPITVVVQEGDVTLALTDESGQQIAQGIIEEQNLPTDSGYILSVSGEAGTYEFSVEAVAPPPTADPPTATPLPVVVAIPTDTPSPLDDLGTFQATISSANPAFGAFNAPEERHVYTFQGAGDSFVRLEMQRTSGTVDPVLTLYTPDGTAIATDDNSGGGRTAFINGVQLPTDGVYTVLATGDGNSGTYEITLESSQEPYPVTPVTENGGVAAAPTQPPIVLTPTVESAVTGALLFDHVPQRASIDRVGGFDRFSIQVDAGETFTVGVVPEGDLRLRLDMLSPTGAIAQAVEAPQADGELVISNFVAQQSDPYTLFITEIGDTTGTYTVSFGRGDTREDIRQGQTVPDRTYESSIERRAIRDLWFLELSQGDIITADIGVTSGDLLPVLEFVAPDGSIGFSALSQPGDDTTEIPSVRANESGLYTLRVRGSTPIETGAYTLIWRYIEAAPTPTPQLLVSDLFAVDDTLPANEFLFYPLQGNAGERVLIEVEAVPGSELDAVVTLLNETGEAFAEDDDSGGNLNPRLLAQIPADGLYQVRVGSYSGTGGTFILRVKRVY